MLTSTVITTNDYYQGLASLGACKASFHLWSKLSRCLAVSCLCPCCFTSPGCLLIPLSVWRTNLFLLALVTLWPHWWMIQLPQMNLTPLLFWCSQHLICLHPGTDPTLCMTFSRYSLPTCTHTHTHTEFLNHGLCIYIALVDLHLATIFEWLRDEWMQNGYVKE